MGAQTRAIVFPDRLRALVYRIRSFFSITRVQIKLKVTHFLEVPKFIGFSTSNNWVLPIHFEFSEQDLVVIWVRKRLQSSSLTICEHLYIESDHFFSITRVQIVLKVTHFLEVPKYTGFSTSINWVLPTHFEFSEQVLVVIWAHKRLQSSVTVASWVCKFTRRIIVSPLNDHSAREVSRALV